jgi:hypothetical protein
MTSDDLYRRFQDHATFCRESLTVETEGRELVPMILGPGQVRLEEAIAKQRGQDRPVRIIYLKSRRIQATTGTAARFFHDTAFHAGVHTVVLAHDETSVQNIFSIYERFYQKYKPFSVGEPVWVPDGTEGRGHVVEAIKLPPGHPLSDRIYFKHGGDPESSFIQIHTAGSTNFGRSFRITNVHFSEFPYYPNPGGTLAAVMSAVPKLPGTTAIVEGTAKTIGDYFHKLWQASIDPSVESEWVGLFMGWWEHPTNRMPLTMPPDQFQESLSREEREMMARFRLTLEQLNWRRWTIVNDFNGDMQHFRREHPATPEDAFMASSRNRFSIPHIQRMPIQRTPMVGELAWEDVGVEQRVVCLPGENGALRIYRMPEPGRCYAAGADPSGGADVNGGDGEPDPDFAVCHIFDRDSHEQCAVLRARLMPGEFGRYVYKLLRFYNNAQVCLERNGAGVGSLESLLNCGYPPGLIYHRPLTPDQDPAVRSDKIGWNTDEVSRQQLLSLLDDAIRQSAIFVHDPITQQELLTFVINARGKAEAQKGCHDDTVMALALTVVVMARMARPRPPAEGTLRPRVSRYGQAVESDSRGRITRLR